MTKRENFEEIKKVMSDNADIVAFCEKEIELLDRKNEKARERAAKKRAESDAMTEAVYAALTDEFAFIDDIVAATEGDEVTRGKVVARLSKLVKAGKAAKEAIKNPEGKGKKTAYKLAD